MKVEELKEKARYHEQREEWQRALDLYRSALRKHDEDEAPDISLFNRVGDIQTRLGQKSAAVEQYGKAIDLYLEAELPNNAIAICKKVLRNFPERNDFFLRMGQIRAAQGFLTDARQSFLTYAERMTGLGDIESALNALVEFVYLSPEDVEIRQGLASQMEAHDRVQEAVEQYTEVYRLLVRSDRRAEAGDVSAKLAELAPDLPLPDMETVLAEAAVQEMEELVVESTSLAGLDADEWLEDQVPEVEIGPLEGPDFADAAHGVETTEVSAGDAVGWSEEPGLHEASGMEAVAGEEEEVAEPLPVLLFEEEEDLKPLPTLGFVEEPGEGEEGDEEGDLEPLPILDLEEAQDGDDAQHLPILAFEEEPEEVVEAGEELADLEPLPILAFEEEPEEVEEAGEELADLEPLPFLAFEEEPEEVGEVGDGPADSAVVSAHPEEAESDDLDADLKVVRDLIRSDPDSVELHQRLVEHAFRAADDAVLIPAYLDLAACLVRTGAPSKASAVYQQVLALSPGHEGALLGIRGLEGASAALPPVEVASSQEYVDLGAMVLGEDAEKTTRWKVAADAPSGDDQADFAKMLSQFKEKVSEHLAVDDVAAHHDLGTAYMEMGLLDEAIGEFQMALRAAPGHLPTHEVMGRCWMEMDKPEMAVRALNRALDAPYEVEDELIGIYYLMGRAKEKLGNTAEALEFYEKVFSLDINFQDVTERLRALR